MNRDTFEFTEDVFGCMVQYPDQKGEIVDHSKISCKSQRKKYSGCSCCRPDESCLLKPPGEWGAEVVFGIQQRFGVPMGYGGPHAAFFPQPKITKEYSGKNNWYFKRCIGNDALRMALQTREQHIKRERATSNICTAQALLAIMAGFYAVYHGEEGIKKYCRLKFIICVLACQKL